MAGMGPLSSIMRARNLVNLSTYLPDSELVWEIAWPIKSECPGKLPIEPPDTFFLIKTVGGT
jgi:hypothetical protein